MLKQVFDSCSREQLNFPHIKENTHSPSSGTKTGSLIRRFFSKQFFSPPPLLPLVWSSVSFSWFFVRLPPLLLPSRRSAPALAGFALPLPLLSAAVPSLRSPLQWAEKHTCQIQVAHRAASHPHQLLSTRSSGPNKFIQHRREALGGSDGLLRWGAQQLVSVGARLTAA